VREYFVGEPQVETGSIIRAYRLENNLYTSIELQSDGYFSQVMGSLLPKRWDI
jgi:hypothetical protein